MSTCFSNSFPMFQPAMRIILSITNEKAAEVTTTIDHDYLDGEIVRLIIPEGFVMQKANGLKGEITIISPDIFKINIDTRLFEPFSLPFPLPSAFTCAQVIPVGEISSTLAGATKNVLPSGER